MSCRCRPAGRLSALLSTGVCAQKPNLLALRAAERELCRLPTEPQGKMLAPRNGGTRLCGQWGANSAGGRAALQGKMLAPHNGGTRLCRQWGANSAGTDLVHESPQSLFLSSPLHQVSGPFRRSAGADLVHRPPQNLVLSFPLHQVSGPFQRSAGTDLVHKSPQNLVLSFPLHQISGPFQRSAGADLVHRPPQDPVLSSSLHQVSGPFRRSAGNGAPTRPAADYRPALGGKFPAGALKAEKENGRGHSPFPLSLNRKLPAGRRKLTNCYSYAVYRSSRYLYRSSASFMYCDAPENIFDKLNR